MKTNIYFKVDGELRQFLAEMFITHSEAKDQVNLIGLAPDDGRIMLTYTKY